ncbi:PspA/IM30 family protein, partial [Frigoribacterium sp. RIT-PI-h]|uniref:PspA/IM30 family protein n=1 Tax=Frigoribacterium sp. RIT-PI-h TaxID=1690245 RepID=UPI0006CC4CDB
MVPWGGARRTRGAARTSGTTSTTSPTPRHHLSEGRTQAKQSIFGRLAQPTRADINSLPDPAEDPTQMLEQMRRGYHNHNPRAGEGV